MATKVIRVEGDIQSPVEKNLEWVQGDSVTIEVVVNDGARLFKNAGSLYTQATFYVDDNYISAAFVADTASITLPDGIVAKYAQNGYSYEVRLEGASENAAIAHGKVMAAKGLSTIEAGDIGDSALHVLSTEDLANIENHKTSLAQYIGTSVDSITMAPSGSLSLTTQSGKNWEVGDALTLIYTQNTAVQLVVDVTGYSGTTLDVDIQVQNGTGTYSDWQIVKAVAVGAGSGVTIDDATPSGATVYSSNKVEAELATRDSSISALSTGKEDALVASSGTQVVLANDAGTVSYADQDAVGPQINDSAANANETWSASKVDAEVTTLQTNIDAKLDATAVPTGGTTGQALVKASNTDRDTEWADQAGGLTVGTNQIVFGNATTGAAEGSSDFTYDGSTRTVRLFHGAGASDYYDIIATTADLQVFNGANWAVFRCGYVKPTNGGGLNLDGTHQILMHTTTGTAYKSNLHNFTGGWLLLPVFDATDTGVSDLNDADIGNDQAVLHHNGTNAKIRFRDKNGNLGTLDLGAITWD